MRRCTGKSATTSPPSSPGSATLGSRCFHRRSPAATATPNFSSARAVGERLVIDHVGHRGDGAPLAAGGSLFGPYALGGETLEVEPVAGHPDRRRLSRIEHASPERIAPLCNYFGACGGCATQHWQSEAYRAWKRRIVVETLAQAGIACEVAELIDAHGAGRRRITVHARRGADGELHTGFA